MSWNNHGFEKRVAEATAFERECERLQLSPDELEQSPALRRWAERNRAKPYVPPELLQNWGIDLSEEQVMNAPVLTSVR
jgi:hypothetical protein